MPYLAMREISKATTKPWFSRLLQHDSQLGNGVGLFWDTTHTHILTYLLSPDPDGMVNPNKNCSNKHGIYE